MSNLLSIPFKKPHPCNVKGAARKYIETHTSIHPDTFRDDFNKWQILRNEGVGGVVHVDRIQSILSYHAQLTSILAKLPPDIGLDIVYAPIFSPEGPHVSLRDLGYERACIVFNLAALYSQLGDAEDRAHIEGIKRATNYYQLSGGTLAFLRTHILSKWEATHTDGQKPLDLTPNLVYGLEWLMLAQAQECFWQKAKLDHLKNNLLSRMAENASSLYAHALSTIRDASPTITHVFPLPWLAHIEAKKLHFAAVAQFRKSFDELESNKYGAEIARLQLGQASAKKAYDIARKGKVAPAILRDIQPLVEEFQKSLARAERDNDLIYHDPVPPPSALQIITHAALAQLKIPPELTSPSPTETLFDGMVGWGAQEAINIYTDRKQQLVQERILDASMQLDRSAQSTLRSLHLPASLDALDQPNSIPPSLIKKAAEVRLEKGPDKIETSINDVRRLYEMAMHVLDEAIDILDKESEEDEHARRTSRIDRPLSHMVNTEYVEREKKFRSLLQVAAESDELVRDKWDDAETRIRELTWEPESLELAVPSTTGMQSPQAAETKKLAKELRILLENLDLVIRDRTQIVRRAQAIAHADDIQLRIKKVANGFERLTELQPIMFEDVLEEEVAKYDRFIKEISESEVKQAEILETIKEKNQIFLNSRRQDPSIKDREQALVALDESYTMYKEIVQNLEEGIKFYNDMNAILLQFREDCYHWKEARQAELHSLVHAMQSMSLNSNSNQYGREPLEELVLRSPSHNPPKKSKMGLPPLNSAEWGFEDLRPAQPPS